MARLRSLGAWLVGAAGAFLLYWCVVVYALGEFNHQYGQDTWFALNITSR